jgi:hypothetical protein
MKACICLIVLILTSCAPPNPPSPVVVDPVLQPYLTSFETDVGVSTDGISVDFANTETNPNPLGETVGECILYSNNTKVIQIDSGYWTTASAEQRKQLIYHELGHCAMGLGHTPGYIASGGMNGCPISIMDPYVFSNLIGCLSSNESYYFNELRSHL